MRGWGSWKIDSSSSWQFCQKAKQQPRLIRKDPGGQEEQVEIFEKILTVDPAAMGRQYGWYTTGDKEAIVHSTFQEGKGSALLFFTPENWEDYMKMHFISSGGHIRTNAPSELNVQPNSLECKALITISDGSRFAEFQSPCQDVSASVVDDETSGIKIMTKSRRLCAVTLGFGQDSINTSIAISNLAPVTVRGADRWTCITDGTEGNNCTNTGTFYPIAPEIVNQSMKTILTSLISDEVGNAHDVILDTSFDLFDFSDVTDVLTLISICLACVVALGFVAYIGFKLFQKKKQVELNAEPQSLP
jgi:hypothetical protein